MIHTLNRPAGRVIIWRLLLSLVLVGCGVALTVAFLRQPEPQHKGVQADVALQTVAGVVKPGESFSLLLDGLVPMQQFQELARQCRKLHPLDQIVAGNGYKLTRDDQGLLRFCYDIDTNDQLVIVRSADGFTAERVPIEYTVTQSAVQGTITSSLFQAVLDSGESDSLAMQLAEVFAWDINFFHDIQAGDSFTAVVEKRYRDGKPTGNGRLLAASFTVQRTTHQAFYFKDGMRNAGYYDHKGRSLRKAFLKAPLSYQRISSGYTMRRRHPITKRVKPHPAIDYAAPTGTPIHTVGDGVVSVAAYNRYNGKYVKVRHANGWQTMYNHLSRFGPVIRKGRTVRQGQVIGYVGSTGLSTGPHLDFRMYRNGRPVNPLKVASPPARPVSAANRAAFRVLVAERLASMEQALPQRNVRLGHESRPEG